jgi:hypothetical protein
MLFGVLKSQNEDTAAEIPPQSLHLAALASSGDD